MHHTQSTSTQGCGGLHVTYTKTRLGVPLLGCTSAGLQEKHAALHRCEKACLCCLQHVRTCEYLDEVITTRKGQPACLPVWWHWLRLIRWAMCCCCHFPRRCISPGYRGPSYPKNDTSDFTNQHKHEHPPTAEVRARWPFGGVFSRWLAAVDAQCRLCCTCSALLATAASSPALLKTVQPADVHSWVTPGSLVTPPSLLS